LASTSLRGRRPHRTTGEAELGFLDDAVCGVADPLSLRTKRADINDKLEPGNVATLDNHARRQRPLTTCSSGH
jgi:hypothetical protein